MQRHDAHVAGPLGPITVCLSPQQRRRWRRLAVGLERLTVVHDGVGIELGDSYVTVQVIDPHGDMSILDDAEELARQIPGTRISRCHRTLRAEVR